MRAQADLFTRYMDLWQAAAAPHDGEAAEPVVQPAKGDKRFADPDWSDNPVFDVIKQSYLLTANWLNDLVGGGRGRRAADQAPGRVLHEDAHRRLLAVQLPDLQPGGAARGDGQTKGESLVKGMENFAADLERGGGQLSISQTDFAQFKVGENVATAPGKVVFQNELIQLLQFAPTTETGARDPAADLPALDQQVLHPGPAARELDDPLADGQGFTVFVTSWVNPDAAPRRPRPSRTT